MLLSLSHDAVGELSDHQRRRAAVVYTWPAKQKMQSSQTKQWFFQRPHLFLYCMDTTYPACLKAMKIKNILNKT